MECDFLDFVLDRKGFGSRWKKWIHGCLSSANFSVIVNGKPGNSFSASRGLRQGDPLSPFLFTLVVDVLGRITNKAKEVSLIEGFEVGRNVSHLQFANNTLFFPSGDEQKFFNFQVILQLFELVSGLKVNIGKNALVRIHYEEDKI